MCADNLSREQRSKTMRAVRQSHTFLENSVLHGLWHCGVRYRRNVRDLPGNPDMAIKHLKIVLFVDSCFWHGCRTHGRIPSTNRDYWAKKISGNSARDREIDATYSEMGWTCLRVWEHDIRSDLAGTVQRLCAEIRSAAEDGQASRGNTQGRASPRDEVETSR